MSEPAGQRAEKIERDLVLNFDRPRYWTLLDALGHIMAATGASRATAEASFIEAAREGSIVVCRRRDGRRLSRLGLRGANVDLIHRDKLWLGLGAGEGLQEVVLLRKQVEHRWPKPRSKPGARNAPVAQLEKFLALPEIRKLSRMKQGDRARDHFGPKGLTVTSRQLREEFRKGPRQSGRKPLIA